MACNLPVVVMSDSPKNCEYVNESGCGFIANPDPASIREVVTGAIGTTQKSREYVMSKWTPQHYAESLMAAL
jgi:hypothetical protein